MLIDLCTMVEQRHFGLRKLNGHIQSRHNFDSFTKDSEEGKEYSYMISRTKVFLKGRGQHSTPISNKGCLQSSGFVVVTAKTGGAV